MSFMHDGNESRSAPILLRHTVLNLYAYRSTLKHGIGVDVFLRQFAQWFTRNTDSSTAAYGSSFRITSPENKKRICTDFFIIRILA